MTDALVAALATTVERAVAVYARQREAGRSDAAARAYARAYAAAFLEEYLEGFAKGYETGQVREQARLKALHDGARVHGPDAQRWVMAIELDSPIDETAEPPAFTLSN